MWKGKDIVWLSEFLENGSYLLITLLLIYIFLNITVDGLKPTGWKNSQTWTRYPA